MIEEKEIELDRFCIKDLMMDKLWDIKVRKKSKLTLNFWPEKPEKGCCYSQR